MRVTNEMVDGAVATFAAGGGFEPTEWDKAAWRAKMRDAITAALSHAAGQDGEQCRAASGFDMVAAMESWHSALDSAKELSANAPDERYRKRASDVVAYLMTRAPNADSTLSRGVPEGRDGERYRFIKGRDTPRALSLSYGSTWIQMGHNGDLDEAIDAAIAAQRKEVSSGRE